MTPKTTVDRREKEGVRIREILEGGSLLALEDGSRWKIAPYFKLEVFDHWRHGDKVSVQEVSDDPGYPWTVFNRDEGFEVSATKLT